MIWNIPNVLTILRLLAAPAVAIMFLYFNRLYADWFALVLFMGAAFTDWFDGFLARVWKQETKFGAMLDPIADKAMVVIALLIIVGYSSMSPWLVLPATIIVFREVFVSGLREFLGDTAGTLKVTRLAKWKTSAQMLAIATLFSQGIFEHHFALSISGLDNGNIVKSVASKTTDASQLWWSFRGMVWSSYLGLWLLWIAAALTLITGLDYFVKAMPFLRDKK
jgi:cardiolipin synthase